MFVPVKYYSVFILSLLPEKQPNRPGATRGHLAPPLSKRPSIFLTRFDVPLMKITGGRKKTHLKVVFWPFKKNNIKSLGKNSKKWSNR